MMNRIVKVVVGIVFSVGLLLIGYLLLDQLNDKEVSEEIKQVTKVDDTVEIPEIEEEDQLDSLPTLETEVANWNEHVKGQLEREGYTMIPSKVEKDESKSTDEITVFSHVFDSGLETRLEISVDTITKEIKEKRLIGYEVSGADRSAIFHAMSIFISYIDNEVSVEEAGYYLGDIPFATNEEGLYEVEFNGKKYDFVLDFSDGLNMLVYRINE